MDLAATVWCGEAKSVRQHGETSSSGCYWPIATVALVSHCCPSTRGGHAIDIIAIRNRQPWNKGKLVWQKPLLRLRDIWSIRVRLKIPERTGDLALYDLAT